ncbi:hypothetical protein [Salinigranum marinum]|uniref:hypothetical protein n=1 Tax=Salinigranum marinum TaxID=1515595 RepID=UPI002989B037|nr:hypothetical protein [Salinigranum marinum]
MTFRLTWHNLLNELEALPSDTTFVTPLSRTPFRITGVQEHRVLIKYRESSETIPLQREQFETLSERVVEAVGGFDLNRLPTDAEPYATILSVHPQFDVDDHEGTLAATDIGTATSLVDVDQDVGDDRDEPDLAVYGDALLLIDALERHDPTALDEMETPDLVNLYTLLSDVQRNANDLRQDVRRVLLGRLHHDQPVHGQYGSVQRTTRRSRTLKPDDEVLGLLEAEGIDRERVLSVDRNKVDDALDVTSLTETDVYDIEESEYVRKADVDEEVKETRLQGLKDRLATADENGTEDLQREIEELEARIDELTSFSSGKSLRSPSSGES